MQSAWNKDLQFTVIRAVELFKFEQAQLASTKIKRIPLLIFDAQSNKSDPQQL
jgi:hypothetical protein